MEFALTDECDASAAANNVILDWDAPIRRPRQNVGGRKGPNLDSLFRAGSTKRILGKIHQAHWSERQYHDLRNYFSGNNVTRERNAAGCFEWTGSRKTKKNTPVKGVGQASFCGVKYNAQLLFYFAMHPDEQMQSADKVVASCGNIICLTDSHLDLQRTLDRRAAAAPPNPNRQPRTACFTLAQWQAMTQNQVEAILTAPPLRYTAPQ